MISQILRKANITRTFIFSTLILITACSRTPSSSDIRASLEREAAEQCKLLDFQNVEKLNGVEISPTEYRISAKYDVVIKPFSELAETWTQLKKREDASIQLQSQLDSGNKSVWDKYTPQVRALEKQSEELVREIVAAASGDYDKDSRYIEIQEKISNAKQQINLELREVSKRNDQAKSEANLGNVSVDKETFHYKTMDMAVKQCQYNSFGWKIMSKALGEGKVQGLVQGATRPMTAELTFIKTENGWRLKL